MFIFDIRAKVGNGRVVIEVDDAELPARPLVSGDPAFISFFPDWICQAHGPFGHGLSDEGLRPNDLAFALSQDEPITYSLVQGELSEYKSPPESCVS